jgi:hypothetical protein
MAASLFASMTEQGDNVVDFQAIINGKIDDTGFSLDKTRSWLERMAIDRRSNTKGAVFFNGQYQTLDEVSTRVCTGRPRWEVLMRHLPPIVSGGPIA